jgi:hypothetical protein
MWAHLVTMILGVWLTASPDALGQAGAARVNAQIVGPLVASLGCIAAWSITRPLRWINLALGAWLVVAAGLVDHGSGERAVNTGVVGVSIAGLALVRGRPRRRMGGGWASLRGPWPPEPTE